MTSILEGKRVMAFRGSDASRDEGVAPTVHRPLAIEGNTLSEVQMTTIL